MPLQAAARVAARHSALVRVSGPDGGGARGAAHAFHATPEPGVTALSVR
jgi:hypothetical protein